MPSKPDPQKDAKLIKLWATDLSPKAIRERMGITEGTLQSMRRRLQLQPKKSSIDWR